MRSQRVVLAMLLLAAALVGRDALAQQLTIPQYTDQQRWNRLNFLAVGFYAAAIAHGKSLGMSVDEIGRFYGELYAPGWGPPNIGLPVRVARGFVLNTVASPNSDAQLVAATDTSATMRFRRAYVPQFGQNGMIYGVTVEEYERFFTVIGERIAAHLGLRHAASVDGDWMTVTFTGRGADAIAAFPHGVFTALLDAQQAGAAERAGTYDVVFHADGTYELRTRDGPVRVRGRYELWLDQIVLGSETGEWACPDGAGTYRFTPQPNGDVVLGRLADACDGRARFVARRWARP